MTLVGTGSAALESYPTSDVVLLNMNLPDMDAYRVCTTIRRHSNVPVIAIVNSDDELDRVLALRSGADDCVPKSCGFHEVVARIDAILSRTRPQQPERDDSIFNVDALTVNVSTREARIKNHIKPLTEKEFDLLAFLVQKHPAAASRKDIMKKVWRTDWAGSSRTIDTHVSSLRAKLGSNEWITSVRGVGYRIGTPTTRPEHLMLHRTADKSAAARQTA